VPDRRVLSGVQPSLRDKRVLVVDNIVNQKVALRLLRRMGYRADVAVNGLEATDAVDRQPDDVVLMDVQMPELDGFEASREINGRWSGDRPRIIAMTANAMQGDRELCEAAGMDDYVAKPIRVEELVAALDRWGMRAETGPPTVAAIDRAVIERLTKTMGGTGLAALARELETMARAGTRRGAGGRLEPLAAGYETAARALGEIRRGLPA
jgi:CheY-like chemotaxis protein